MQNSKNLGGLLPSVALTTGLIAIGLIFLCVSANISLLGCYRAEYSSPRTSGIEWSACGDGFECGRLLVPLDYRNRSIGYANLSVGRLLARNKTARLGSLFVNPGGPGNSGLEFLYRAGSELADLLDNRYDIVSWDPRGVNETIPALECYASQTDQDIAFSHTSADIFDARNLSDPVDRAVYAQQVRKADAEYEVIAKLCLNRTGEALRHVGTASVVRDLELLSRVIEGPGKAVNFWGFSYGTIIGLYFVNMFPHRVGKVILDGVVDPLLWSSIPAYQWGKWDCADAESAYTSFLNACVDAGPERCALCTSQTTTASTIRQAADKLIDELYEHPLPVSLGEQPYIVTSGMVRRLIFTRLYRPRTWPDLAQQLAATIRGNGRPILDAMVNRIELDTRKKPRSIEMTANAVKCVDGPDITSADPRQVIEDAIQENVLMYENTTSRFAGFKVPMCHHWKVRDTERFIGPFNSTSLANNILIIGNVVDPMTPLINARLVNSMLPQSRLIIQNSTGHCSYSMASLCTGKAIRRYFLKDEIPPNEVLCEITEQLFPATPSNTEDKAWLKSDVTLSEEDENLVVTLRRFGRAMSESPRSRDSERSTSCSRVSTNATWAACV